MGYTLPRRNNACRRARRCNGSQSHPLVKHPSRIDLGIHRLQFVTKPINARRQAGTIVAEGKPVAEFDGQKYIQERSLKADVALVKAWKGDKSGNLIYRMTARNFNPNVATAGKITIAEVEQLVETGELDADQIHTPGIFVQRIILNTTPEKRIEQRTVRRA